MSGDYVINNNKSSNIEKSVIYVCPICGNIIHSMGKAVITCCGITLPELDAEEVDDAHNISIEKIEDEFVIKINHEMTKKHYISFVAYSKHNKFEIIKLYAEGGNEIRIPALNNITARRSKALRVFFFSCSLRFCPVPGGGSPRPAPRWTAA